MEKIQLFLQLINELIDHYTSGSPPSPVYKYLCCILVVHFSCRRKKFPTLEVIFFAIWNPEILSIANFAQPPTSASYSLKGLKSGSWDSWIVLARLFCSSRWATLSFQPGSAKGKNTFYWIMNAIVPWLTTCKWQIKLWRCTCNCKTMIDRYYWICPWQFCD